MRSAWVVCVLCAAGALFISPCAAQEGGGEGSAAYQEAIYRAYIQGDMASWKRIIGEMQQSRGSDQAALLELVNYQYGYIGWCLGNERKKEAERYLKLAQKNLEALEESGANPSMTDAYRSAFIGFRIGLNVLLAPFIGLESVKRAKAAIEQDPQNPYGYIQYANAQSYMPAAFGGSKTEALEHYRGAQALMEAGAERAVRDWNYLSLLVSIAQTYSELRDYRNARAYLEKTLAIEPAFAWVRDELYPRLLEDAEEERAGGS